MEHNYIEKINNMFIDLGQEAEKAIKNEYLNICSRLKKTDYKGLGGEIANMESVALNKLMISLVDNVRQASIEEMMNYGCKDYLTQAGWTEIQQIVGVPRIELCKVKIDRQRTNGTGSHKEHSSDSKFERNIKQYDSNKKIGAGIAVGGAALTAITIIIPGWNIPTVMLCAAGVAIAVAGGGSAAYNEIQKQNEISKFADMKRNGDIGRKASDNDMNKLVRQITESQCRHNTRLYHEWLETVRKGLIEECDKLKLLS